MADQSRAIQYATTSDGMRIAYSTIGSGVPLIFLPQVWQNLQRLSAQSYFGPTLRHWARRFRVVLYDSRGQGLSQRGLPDDHSLECYDHDLRTVIDAVEAEKVILFSSHQFSRTAIRYASHYPNRVAALVAHFYTAGGPNVMFSREMLELARTNWDGYIHLVVNVAAKRVTDQLGQDEMTSYIGSTADQSDFIKLMQITLDADVSADALNVKAPTLIITTDTPARAPDLGKNLAQLIPNSRLIVEDVIYTPDGETTPMAALTESFFDEVLGRPRATAPSRTLDGLSSREMEVLRLIAAGRSNPQIASELMISLNTVQRHVSHIFDKTGTGNRTEAASYATRYGITA